MSSKASILEAVLRNQPPSSPLPSTEIFRGDSNNAVESFMTLFTGIGGKAELAANLEEVIDSLKNNFDQTKRWVTTLPELYGIAEPFSEEADAHSFQDVELSIIRAQFSVAENGANWIPETLMGNRIIPFICQHLAVIVNAENIVPTMHEAYHIIGEGDYGYGAFIAGPSKTADIEQSLVMGAHGPISMTVYVIK